MSKSQVDSTRKELFITLEYLVRNCHDSKHTSKTIELTEYASKEHNVNLDRRRANDILEFLVYASDEYSFLMPFKVIKVENKPRYYVEYSLFDKDSTKKIAEAIFKDGSLSKGFANKLVDLFLLKTATPEDAKTIKTNLDKKEKFIIRQSETNAKHMLSFEMLRDEQLRFTFKPRGYVDLEKCSSNHVFTFFRNLSRQPHEDDRFCGGIVYEVITKDNKTDIVIYLPDIMGTVILNQEDIVVKPHSRFNEQINAPSFKIESDKYEDIDKMIESYYNGNAGIAYQIEFKFNVGKIGRINEELISERKRDFEQYFKVPFEYTLQERDVIFEGGDGEEPRHVTAIDLHSSVISNFSSFKNWYWRYGLFENLVVLSPKYFNNRLLGVYIERFKNRLEKYGETQEERNERLRIAREQREHFLQMRAERRARQQAQSQVESNKDDGGN